MWDAYEAKVPDQVVSFALHFESMGSRIWNNNGGANYSLETKNVPIFGQHVVRADSHNTKSNSS